MPREKTTKPKAAGAKAAKKTATKSVAATKKSPTKKSAAQKASSKKTAKSSTFSAPIAVIQAPVPTQSTPSMALEAGPYSFETFILTINNNFAVILLVGIFALLGFFVGSVWTENSILKGGGSKPAAQPTAVGDAGAQDPSGPSAAILANVPEVTDEDHIRGSKNAKIMLIEYSDYECPFCASFHPTMQQVMDEYGDDVAWVMRDYPLSFHPLAQPAAEASECVADQYGEDAFWAYGDLLFEKTTAGSLTEAALYEAVTELGYDQAAVKTCVENGDTTAEVQADLDGGTAAGIAGTPGTIIVTADGDYQLISGALPFESVKQMIDPLL